MRRRVVRAGVACVVVIGAGTGAWLVWGGRLGLAIPPAAASDPAATTSLSAPATMSAAATPATTPATAPLVAGASTTHAAPAAAAPDAAAVPIAAPPGCTAPSAPVGNARLNALIASWTKAHPLTAVTVWDTTGDVADPSDCPVAIVSHDASLPLLPASNNKLTTSAAALLLLGPTYRYTTRLVVAGPAAPTGSVLKAPVTLVGSGDPLFSTYAYAHAYLGSNGDTLDALAARARRASADRPALTKVTGGLHVNGGIFDARTLPPYWYSGDVGSIQPLSGIATNEDFAGNTQEATVASPVLAAAQRMRTALRAAHVAVSGAIGFGAVPADPVTLAEVSSPTLATILRIMNVPSDDFIAEQLSKTIDAQVHRPGTSAGGADLITRVMKDLGAFQAGDRIVDGSGLARQDRLTNTTLLRLLLDAQRAPAWGAALIGSLPRPGQGTLEGRLAGLAKGASVVAKTGTLRDVSSLTGIVHGANRHVYTFSILCNGLDPALIGAAHTFQDALVRDLAAGVS